MAGTTDCCRGLGKSGKARPVAAFLGLALLFLGFCLLPPLHAFALPPSFSHGGLSFQSHGSKPPASHPVATQPHINRPQPAAPRSGAGQPAHNGYRAPDHAGMDQGPGGTGREMAFQGQPPPRGVYPSSPQRGPANGYRNGQPVASGGEHLGAWMRQHRNESPADQERALRQEPGFNRLPPQQQQNLVNRLHQLNQMPPEQRERTLDRIESMERLSPQMREAVKSSAQQLALLSPDRKRLVQKAFRDLRDMPPEQRQAIMDSPRFAGQFSAQERSIMGNLLVVEPYRRAAPAAPPQQYGRQ